MRPSDKKTHNVIKKMFFKASSELDNDIWLETLQTHNEFHGKEIESGTQNVWRIAMRNNIIKIATAAIIIIAILIAIHYSGGSIDGSSVVWANVLTKVETCRGYQYRLNGKITSFSDYSIWFRAPGYFKADFYVSETGELVNTWYKDMDKGTITYVLHNYKSFNTYNGQPAGQEDSQSIEYLLDKILSTEHKELGQKTIDGILCQGLETSDPATLGPEAQEHQDQIMKMQIILWVDVETKYPVLIKMNGSFEDNDNILDLGVVYDQFQWGVDFEPSFFEPNIPWDYRENRPPTRN